ncbi:MAG: hypothetical protein ACLFUU_07745 [Desulfobacteraceae bacterium]
MPPIFGENFLGSIPCGTFPRYSIYSAFLTTFLFGHFFVRHFRLPKILLVGTIFMIFAAGARSSIIVTAFIIILWLMQSYVRKVPGRLAMGTLIPFLALFLVFALPNLTGRVGTSKGLTKDPRWEKYEDYFNGVYNKGELGFLDLALGTGVGLASNAVTVVYGPGAFRGQFSCEPMHLALVAQYGFLGLGIIYTAFFALLYKLFGRVALIIGAIQLLYGFGQTLWEFYPANLLMPIMLAFHTSNFEANRNIRNSLPP